MPNIEDTGITGTLDELEPILRSRGYSKVITMAGPIDLSTFDPYGMRRAGSVNLRGKWADDKHAYRGMLAYVDGRPYLADLPLNLGAPFVRGLFPLE